MKQNKALLGLDNLALVSQLQEQPSFEFKNVGSDILKQIISFLSTEEVISFASCSYSLRETIFTSEDLWVDIDLSRESDVVRKSSGFVKSIIWNANLTKTQSITLDGCSIDTTNGVLQKILSIPTLQHLSMRNCVGVTPSELYIILQQKILASPTKRREKFARLLIDSIHSHQEDAYFHSEGSYDLVGLHNIRELMKKANVYVDLSICDFCTLNRPNDKRGPNTAFNSSFCTVCNKFVCHLCRYRQSSNNIHAHFKQISSSGSTSTPPHSPSMTPAAGTSHTTSSMVVSGDSNAGSNPTISNIKQPSTSSCFGGSNKQQIDTTAIFTSCYKRLLQSCNRCKRLYCSSHQQTDSSCNKCGAVQCVECCIISGGVAANSCNCTNFTRKHQQQITTGLMKISFKHSQPPPTVVGTRRGAVRDSSMQID